MLPFSIEFAPSFRPRPIRHVVMDWDGTTVLSRAGWCEMMTDIYVENLPHLHGETEESRREYSWAELMRLTGRPSIHQMEHLAALVAARGGTPAEPAQYQAAYQQRLARLVEERLDQIRSGTLAAATLLLTGVVEMFGHLRERGIRISLATGTPLADIRAEVALLGVADYFDGGIFGPADIHDREFSKRAIIDALLREYALDGCSLLAFGDGPAEIAAAKAVGGLAVAVASDESNNGSGRIDPAKRAILLGAGADAVIADFRQPSQLLDALTR